MIDRSSRRTALLFLLFSLVPAAALAGVFDLPELHVTPSPAQACSIALDGVEKVVDYDVSPAGPLVAALVKSKDGDHQLVFWTVGAQELSLGWNAPAGFVPRAVAWHPRAGSLFVAGAKGAQYQILRLDKRADGWSSRTLFESPNELRRLVVGPSPFDVGYRLFLGMKNPDGKTYRIVSVTEEGKRFYQVVGPAETFTTVAEVDSASPAARIQRFPADPGTVGYTSRMQAAFALPLAFHPAGHQLIWEDGNLAFHRASYVRDSWGESTPLLGGAIHGGSITYTPNSMGLLHWQPSSAGIGLFLLATNREKLQAPQFQFVATPSSVPDGRGIVGLTKSGPLYTLQYVPIAVPVADVVNAWLFCESDTDVDLFEKNGGLFRGLPDDQLYKLYESENYYCGGYDHTTPTRPYLVTTDIFWEVFAAAYEGLFIVNEREQSIPEFWEFVSGANDYFKKSTGQSRWKPVFEALSELRAKTSTNPETARIRAADGRKPSDIVGVEVDYGELKPRGFYASSPGMKDYFKAFRYLNTVFAKADNRKELMGELRLLPSEVKGHALAWVESYQGFISPSRAPLVWQDSANDTPPYARHLNLTPELFPLSWGFDNEVLLTTVMHLDWPPAEQITGPSGPRLIPSGLDVAAALGSDFADSLLQPEYEKYPVLRKAIANLKRLFDTKGKASPENRNLYDRWMTALALQWADDVRPPDGGKDERIWRAKRVQTGLASWATLRHATVLVNERTAGECGEGGFEEIILRAPRGYVEPDPRTFGAIAGLFETAIKNVGQGVSKDAKMMKEPSPARSPASMEALRKGIVRRLTESAQKARMFQVMAEKEIRGEILTNQEYEEILNVGRIAEHHFLVFKSLANKEHALSDPDPISKIADVAGGKEDFPLLMAAVGKPVEWDHIVPYFGRHLMVKGSVYSYYEFASQQLLDDAEWRSRVDSQPRPAWIQPYFAE